MADISLIFFLSLTIIAIGFIIKKLKVIKEEDGKVIGKLIINITLPAQIIFAVSQMEIDPTLLLLPFISIFFSFLVTAISYLLFRNQPREIKGLVLMTTLGLNVFLFAFPIIHGIYGDQVTVYISMFDVGNAFIIFVFAFTLGMIFSPKNSSEELKVNMKEIGKNLLKSIPLMSYIIAIIINVVLNVSGASLPVFFSDVLTTLSSANAALMLLLLGIYLNFKFEKNEWSIVLKILIIRYGFGIIIGLILFFTLPFTDLYRLIVLIMLVLPPGMTLLPYIIEFEYNEKVVGMVVNISIFISFILMFFLIGISGIT
jgi:predicted permease